MRRTLLACVLLFVAAPLPAHSAARAQALYSSSPHDVIASLSRIANTLQDPDQAPLVSVFGDGRVAVHFPRGRSRSGTYELRLSEFELARLIQTLINRGLADFDTDAALSRKRSIRAQRQAAARRAGRAKVFYDADYTVTVVSLNLIDYKPVRGAGAWRGPVSKRIRWVGLDGDARSFRKVEPIRNLAAAVSELARLTERAGLDQPQ